MKPLSHWIVQYLVATVTMFVLLLVIDLLRGTPVEQAWASCLLWAAAASAIFVGSRYRQAARGDACAVCETTKRK
ncbi:MAG TPA: hypothetical protein VNT33_16425 [Telluria sp.]|nr:hypothetical protein [Telluria sp.]